jgi:hypothetical protein
MNTLINTTLLEDKDLITIEELSESLRMSQNTIYRISFKGELKPLKYRGRNYWKVEDVKSYLIGKGILRSENSIKSTLAI